MPWLLHDNNNESKEKKASNKQRERREKKGSEDESQKGTNACVQVRKRIQKEEFLY